MKFYILSIFLLLEITLSTCTFEVATPEVCFQENVLPVFISNCTMGGCHNPINGGGEGVADLTNYDAIMKAGVTPKHPLLSEVYTQIRGHNPKMPPSGKLSAKDVNYIKVWIKMGAKNTSNCSICDSTNYSYSGKIQPLFELWCVGCHSGSTIGGGYDLSTYNGVLATIDTNVSTITTKLYVSLNHTGPKPMPQNSKISACDLNALKKWIDAGAPNN